MFLFLNAVPTSSSTLEDSGFTEIPLGCQALFVPRVLICCADPASLLPQISASKAASNTAKARLNAQQAVQRDLVMTTVVT